MYGIYGNIYHQYTPNVSIYTIHGSYGYMFKYPFEVVDLSHEKWIFPMFFFYPRRILHDEVQVALGDGPRRYWPEILDIIRGKKWWVFPDLAWDHGNIIHGHGMVYMVYNYEYNMVYMVYIIYDYEALFLGIYGIYIYIMGNFDHDRSLFSLTIIIVSTSPFMARQYRSVKYYGLYPDIWFMFL